MDVLNPWPLTAWRTLRFGLARLTSPDGTVDARARPFDLVFTGPAQDVITRHIYRFGVHEPDITRYLLREVRLRAGDVALDVGANLGWYSLLLDRLAAPGADVFAFEPDPHSYALLTRNLARNDARYVRAFNLALGETSTVTTLHRYKSSNNGRHTLLDGSTSGGTVEVPVMPLTRFWAEQALGERPVRLMKVDVEGFEYFVLKGAGELLRRCAHIVLEYSPEALGIAGLDRGALLALLKGYGLRARRFTAGGLVEVSWEALAQAPSQWDLLLTPGPPGSN